MSLLREYFIDPIYQGTGYNAVNTVVYGLLLGFGIMACDGLVRRLGLRIDRRFLVALLPFLALASVLRSLVDAQLLPRSFFLITPGIFILVAALAAGALLIGKALPGRFRYPYGTAAIGLALLVYPAYILIPHVKSYMPFLQIALLLAAATALTVIALRRTGWGDPFVEAIFVAHLLDASATIVAVEYYGFWEEHVFEDFLIQAVGTAYVILPFKLLVLVLVTAFLRRTLEGDSLRFWYFALFVLGFAPGLRDTLTVMLLGQ
ncbi:MAG: DUF63 family protein [Candidatus Hydrothermarchaeota archaeon]